MSLQVIPQVTSLTHGLEMVYFETERRALTDTFRGVKMYDCQHDFTSCPLGWFAIHFYAPAWPWVSFMQATFTDTLATTLGE